MKNVGMLLLVVGGTAAAIGLVLVLADKIPWLDHLPGDLLYRREHNSFHFPLTTCTVVSMILPVVLNLVLRWFRR